MKLLSRVCLVVGVIIFVLGLLSKFVLKSSSLQPASYLFVTQTLIILRINFVLYVFIKKK